MNPITSFLVAVLVLIAAAFAAAQMIAPAVLFGILAAVVAMGLKMANTWQKFVVLRAGKLMGVKGPGLFLIVPVLDTIVAVIDERIQTTAFAAEQTLTRDTVPVNVDAIIFWRVHDARSAALEITDYRSAIDRVAQTSLRETIGSTMLSTLLADRKKADALLRDEIGRKTEAWGVTVISVEIRDVAIPEGLQDSMSRQAQAEREKEARIILGSAEAEVASKFVEAAKLYASHPAALQLRAMNIVYETTKERGATILMPSTMVDAMSPAAVATAVAMSGAGATAAPVRAAPVKRAAPKRTARKR